MVTRGNLSADFATGIRSTCLYRCASTLLEFLPDPFPCSFHCLTTKPGEARGGNKEGLAAFSARGRAKSRRVHARLGKPKVIALRLLSSRPSSVSRSTSVFQRLGFFFRSNFVRRRFNDRRFLTILPTLLHRSFVLASIWRQRSS